MATIDGIKNALSMSVFGEVPCTLLPEECRMLLENLSAQANAEMNARYEKVLIARIAKLEGNIAAYENDLPLLRATERIAELEGMVQDMDKPGSWYTPEERRELATRIVELEAAQRWIPVKERLPEDATGVLIFGDAISQMRDIGLAYHISNIPQWATDEGLYFHGDSYKRVTHWMPLPEPPEVE